eukprot:GHRR01029160.1.p1 GENE.GHRR01029160.1~~GHRR01029160.1.p1  ORF type:complete len:148 (+),score=19.89 GHRR01029160.1:422-865(+)
MDNALPKHFIVAIDLANEHTHYLASPNCVCVPFVHGSTTAVRSPPPESGVATATDQLPVICHRQAQHRAFMAVQLFHLFATMPCADGPARQHGGAGQEWWYYQLANHKRCWNGGLTSNILTKESSSQASWMTCILFLSDKMQLMQGV